MIIAALLDLGMPLSIVTRAVEAVGFEGARVSAKKVTVGALSATHFEVDSADQTERSYRDIKDLLEASSLAAPVRDLALEIFEVLGRAEAQVHGVPLDRSIFTRSALSTRSSTLWARLRSSRSSAPAW
jgi:uncharacterized protein (DUF111 family)